MENCETVVAHLVAVRSGAGRVSGLLQALEQGGESLSPADAERLAADLGQAARLLGEAGDRLAERLQAVVAQNNFPP